MDKVRFGVVGTNFITDWVINGARQDSRFILQAVCSRTAGRAAEFAAKHGIPDTYTSLEEMASSPKIDAVYIASPNFMHASQSILCMSLGKHVMCEKPVASNAAEAAEMIRASEKYNVTFMEAMKPTLTPGFRAVMDSLGRAGKIRRYFSSYCQYSSRYDRFKAGIPMTAFSPEYSNGAVMDIGVYTIYPMIVLFGKPDKIIASGTKLSSGVDGQGTAIFRYNDMEASVIYSKISDSSLPTEIQGENGTVSIDRINSIGSVRFSPVKAASRKSAPAYGDSPEEIRFIKDNDEYFYEVREFIDLVLSGKRESAINSHRNSLATMETVDEIRRQCGVRFPADDRILI